jgi:hypothetical protein
VADQESGKGQINPLIGLGREGTRSLSRGFDKDYNPYRWIAGLKSLAE